METFLPSQARWTFDWIYRVAIPALMDPRFFQRNQVMCTDGDSHMYSPFVSVAPTLYPSSCHRLCAWHLLRQGMKEKGLLTVPNDPFCASRMNVYEAVKKWLWSWTHDLETAREMDLSIKLLQIFLEDKKVQCDECLPSYFVNKLTAFINSNVLVHREKFASYIFSNRRCIQNRTTNAVEIEGSALKRHSSGPKPFNSLDTSMLSIDRVNRTRQQQKAMQSAELMDDTPTVVADKYFKLYDELTAYAAKIAVDNYERRDIYGIYRHSAMEFYVKCAKYEQLSDSKTENYYKYIVPRFERTRVVSIEKVNGRNYLVCSCNKHKQIGLLCGHIHAVRNTVPTPSEMAIRWHKIYDHMYLKGDGVLDGLIDDLFENEAIGPEVDSAQCFRADIGVGTTTHHLPVNYFTRSLPNMDPVLHPGVKWGSMDSDNVVDEIVSRTEEAASLNASCTENVLFGVHQHIHLSALSSSNRLRSNIEDFGGNTCLSTERMSDSESMSSSCYNENKVDLQDHINFLCDAESGLTDGCSKHLSAYRLFLSRFKELCSLTGNTQQKMGVMKKGFDLIEMSLLQMSIGSSNTAGSSEGIVSLPRAFNNRKHGVRLGKSPPKKQCRRSSS